MARVHLSGRALKELADILAYIERESGSRRADLVDQRIEWTLANLAEFPEAARRMTLGGAKPFRFAIHPWVVVYELLEDEPGIRVLRILDGRRDLSDIL